MDEPSIVKYDTHCQLVINYNLLFATKKLFGSNFVYNFVPKPNKT